MSSPVHKASERTKASGRWLNRVVETGCLRVIIFLSRVVHANFSSGIFCCVFPVSYCLSWQPCLKSRGYLKMAGNEWGKWTNPWTPKNGPAAWRSGPRTASPSGDKVTLPRPAPGDYGCISLGCCEIIMVKPVDFMGL